MAELTKPLDPEKYHVSVNGVPAQGYADGTYINLTYDDNLFTEKVGADGEVARIKNAGGFKATLELTLLQTSSTNDYYDALMIDDYVNGIPFAVSIKDSTGRTHLTSADSWIMKAPDVTMAKDEITSRIWTFKLAKVTGIIGGN